jgi:peptidoglycan hydrolase-like protein with peptidoglycan-binding domain
MKKIDKRVWWSLPIILGVYLIYRQFKKGSTPKLEPTITEDIEIANGGTYTPSYSSKFPLKNGSRDAGSPNNPQGLVVDLQKLINSLGGYTPKIGYYVNLPIKLKEDGIFGNNTEWAIEQYIGKKTIDNQADIENLKIKMLDKKNLYKLPTF